MSTQFDDTSGLLVVGAEISGPSGNAVLRLAIDTGATKTLLNAAVLRALGYDTAKSEERIEITTGSGIEFCPVVEIESIACLDERLLRFQIVCHTLPPSTAVDGLLGLDFMEGGKLEIDFSKKLITFSR